MDHIIDMRDILAEQPDFRFVGPGDINSLTSVLGQRAYNNIIYAGKSGVGKTANIYGIVQSQGVLPNESTVTLPLHIYNRKFYLLNVSKIFEGEEEDIRNNFKIAIAILKSPGSNVLVVEDVNDLLNAIDDHGVPGIISLIMDELKKGSFQSIFMVRLGAGGESKLKDVIGCHSDMEELFTVIKKSPSNKETTLRVVSDARSVIEQHHDGLTITDDVCEELVELTHTYPTLAVYQREQPARTLRLLDNISSIFITSSNGETNTSERSTAVKQLQDIRGQKNNLLSTINEQQGKFDTELGELTEWYEQEHEHEPSEIDLATYYTSDMKHNMRMVRAANNELINEIEPNIHSIMSSINVNLTLGLTEVKSIFSDLSGIPTSDMDDNESEKILGLESKMLESIYGQEMAVKTIVGAIKKSKAGLKPHGKPIGGYILLGSSGVGKTYLAEVLAKVLFDDESNMTSFDMSEFKAEHTLSRLIGAPPGYAGYGSGGALTNAVRKNPHQVILLDEVEKAHPEVFKILLQMLDKGRLSDELGTVDYSNTVILLTTNLAQHLSLDATIDPKDDDTREEVISNLRSIFPQELINRVDDFLLFKALSNTTIKKIVEREIVKINKSISSVGITITLGDDDIDSLIEDRYKPEEGSRQILKFIGNNLTNQLADIILEHPEGGNIDVRYDSLDNVFNLTFQG